MFYFAHCVFCPSLIYEAVSQRRTENTMAKIKHATLIEEFEDTKWVI
jgi:hypothetical protein